MTGTFALELRITVTVYTMRHSNRAWRAMAGLEQVPRPAEPRVDGPRVAPVRFGKRRPQPVAAGWRHDQMGMIGH